jgi:hemoglobin
MDLAKTRGFALCAKVVLVIILIVLICIFTYIAQSTNIESKPKEKSLYDRLGGVFNIAAVINKFSDDLVENEMVGKNTKNPYLHDWYANHIDRLSGLKFMRTLWLCAVSGGKYTYTPTRAGKFPFGLENAHMKLHISTIEFVETAKVLSNTLDSFNVPEKEKKEVLSAFASHQSEVTTGYFVDKDYKIPVGKFP